MAAPTMKAKPEVAFRTPHRFLDVGCGIGMPLILKLALEWPQCHFTGFDIAPNLLDLDWLPASVRHRISYVQGNYLQPFPWEDAAFDGIYLNDLGSSTPEHKWEFVFEEAARVCSADGFLEVNQSNFKIGGYESFVEIQAFQSKKKQSVEVDLSPEALVVLGLIAACEKRLLTPFPTPQ
jgi:SAM-dependent methyltransferase